MSINRNAPCPCGSGKKYKKCCLQKTNVIQLEQIQEQRFFNQKHELTMKLLNFVFKRVDIKEEQNLQQYYREEANDVISKEMRTSHFNFWLSFVHRFKNGKRGIEWFYEEESEKLSSQEHQLASDWVKMVPRFIQYIEPAEKGIMVKDIFTEERFYMPNCETLKENSVLPFSISLMFLEPYKDGYCMHGLAFWQAPNLESLERVYEIVNEGTEKTSVHELILTNYLQFLSAMNIRKEVQEKEIEISETTYRYDLVDREKVISFFSQYRPDVVTDEWKPDYGTGKFSWVEDWYRYEDSLSNGRVHIAEVSGQLELTDKQLVFSTRKKEKVEQHTELIADINDAIKLADEDELVTKLKAPSHVFFLEYCVLMDNADIPQQFAQFAQVQHQFESAKNAPIPSLGNRSISELIDANEVDLLERWVNMQEYNSFRLLEDQFKSLEITENTNVYRKQMGVPLSPFVTGGENRTSTITPCDNPMQPTRTYTEEEIELYEKLGFTPQTASAFYAKDVLAFYHEKTDGKSAATVRKYERALSIFVDFCEDIELDQKGSWAALKDGDWGRVVLDYPFKIYGNVSKSLLQELNSTMKAFRKWIN